jgi:hypothetical protein
MAIAAWLLRAGNGDHLLRCEPAAAASIEQAEQRAMRPNGV